MYFLCSPEIINLSIITYLGVYIYFLTCPFLTNAINLVYLVTSCFSLHSKSRTLAQLEQQGCGMQIVKEVILCQRLMKKVHYTCTMYLPNLQPYVSTVRYFLNFFNANYQVQIGIVQYLIKFFTALAMQFECKIQNLLQHCMQLQSYFL